MQGGIVGRSQVTLQKYLTGLGYWALEALIWIWFRW